MFLEHQIRNDFFKDHHVTQKTGKLIFDQINAALVNIKDFFQKLLKILLTLYILMVVYYLLR